MQSELKAAVTFDCDFGAQLRNLLWKLFPPKMNSSGLQSGRVVAKVRNPKSISKKKYHLDILRWHLNIVLHIYVILKL